MLGIFGISTGLEKLNDYYDSKEAID